MRVGWSGVISLRTICETSEFRQDPLHRRLENDADLRFGLFALPRGSQPRRHPLELTMQEGKQLIDQICQCGNPLFRFDRRRSHEAPRSVRADSLRRRKRVACCHDPERHAANDPRRRVPAQRGWPFASRGQPGCFGLAGQLALHFTEQGLIAVTGLLEKVCPVLLFQLQSRVKKLLDPLPAFRRHNYRDK